MKYYAKIVSIVKKDLNQINRLSKYHIWTDEHVKSYLSGKKAYIWVLRVYKLKEPAMSERTRGLRYANLFEELPLDGIEPVLNDSEFYAILNDILGIN